VTFGFQVTFDAHEPERLACPVSGTHRVRIQRSQTNAIHVRRVKRVLENHVRDRAELHGRVPAVHVVRWIRLRDA